MRATALHRVHCPRTWIEVCPVSAKRWGLGCWVCRQMEHVKPGTAESDGLGRFGSSMVRQPSKSRLLKHQSSDRHRRAAQLFLRLRGLASGTDGIAAPTVEEFASVLLRIRRNELEAPSRGSREKHATMSWCLYEAHREAERKFLAQAVCMSVVQDASTRGPLLLTRYIACGPGLERACGILQVVDGRKHSGAQALAKSVLRGIRAMATKRRRHPGTYKTKTKQRRLVAFARHLASIVEVFVADGAADEQLAGRMLHKLSARAELGHTLPNLRLVVRDKPHSARRLLQRTLPKDRFISKLMARLLWSRGSLARLVQHSAQHQETFRRHQVRHMGGAAATLRNLSYAAQRFDSTARPLGRMVIHFEALVMTAVDIIRERQPASREHQGANNALDMLNTESMLQLGMVADACEIVVRFIRFLDKECFDISALPCHIQTLRDSATDLFKHGGCMRHAGYTQRMLGLIRKPRMVVVYWRSAQDARGHQLTKRRSCGQMLRPNGELVEIG